MKKLFIFSAFIASFILLSMSSCEKFTLPSMKANFDQTEKNFIFRSTVKGEIPDVGDGFMIVATTSSDIKSGEYLTLMISGIEEKEYNLEVSLSEGKYECAALYRKGGESDTVNVYAGTNGTIIINKIDEDKKKISGTFSFTLMNKDDNTDIITVTDGEFKNLLYTDLGILSSDDFNF